MVKELFKVFLTTVHKSLKLPKLQKLPLRKNLFKFFSTDYWNYQFYWNYHFSGMVKELFQSLFNYSTQIPEITKITEITAQKNLPRFYSIDYWNYQFYWNYHFLEMANELFQRFFTIVHKLPNLPKIQKLPLRKNLSQFLYTDYQNYQFYWNYHFTKMVKELFQSLFTTAYK